VPVAEEITSPELVLVSPPELAALARDALPNYEVEYERWVVDVRAALAADELEPEPEPAPEAELATEPKPYERPLTAGAFAFTALSAIACVAPLVLLIVFR
jgi:hypothetical protein